MESWTIKHEVRLSGLRDMIEFSGLSEMKMVECGVNTGISMCVFMESGKVFRYDGFDVWKGGNGCKAEAFKKAEKWKGSATLRQMDSVEASKLFEDASLDLVYIDTLHTYDLTLREIDAWSQKVREGGCLSGHDVNWGGTGKAVAERLGANPFVFADTSWLFRKTGGKYVGTDEVSITFDPSWHTQYYKGGWRFKVYNKGK